MVMKTCNSLYISTAILVTDKKYFISALKGYLNDRSFYLTDEYLLTDIRSRLRMALYKRHLVL